MNEEIHCITNEGKMAKNEWKNNDSDFLRAFDSILYEKLRQFFFIFFNIYSLTYLKKDSSVLIFEIFYKYLNKLVS